MSLTLVCGYRRTGKDTLCKILNGDHTYSWLIYGKQNSKYVSGKVERLAFADALKKEVEIEYGVPADLPDSQKEAPLYLVKLFEDLVSARRIWIYQGALRRSQDIDYWCSIIHNSLRENHKYIITDWRFPNEYEFFAKRGLVDNTIRIFRSQVPIPPLEEASEHSLDSFLTDFLLVTSEEEFVTAKSQFPQYSSYCKLGSL